MADQLLVQLKENEILFKEGSQDTDLYYIQSGKLLVFVAKQSEMIPLAQLGAGEFIGELSFFDHNPRSANVASLEPSKLLKIPPAQVNKFLPSWMILLAKFLIKNIRQIDLIIKEKGIKKKKTENVSPLSMEQQTALYHLLKNQPK